MKKLTILLSIFFSIEGSGQDSFKWFDKNDVGVIITQAIAGAADGTNESIQHHRLGLGNQFWDYKVSWQNKYKDWPEDTRSAYPFSKNILAFTTDGYHLTRTTSRLATLGTIAIVAGDFKQYKKSDRGKVIAKKVVLSIVANRVFFNVVYLTTNNSK